MAENAELNDWVTMIKTEYQEMPGLDLTEPQVRRLWSLEPSLCEVLLRRLQDEHFLRLTSDGHYIIAGNCN